MYYLWAFGDYNRTVITRGENQAQAFIHASKNWNRGEVVTFYPFCPIWSAKQYDKNHPFDWLHIPPKWLQDSL